MRQIQTFELPPFQVRDGSIEALLGISNVFNTVCYNA
jgi:hypothetical protein